VVGVGHSPNTLLTMVHGKVLRIITLQPHSRENLLIYALSVDDVDFHVWNGHYFSIE